MLPLVNLLRLIGYGKPGIQFLPDSPTYISYIVMLQEALAKRNDVEGLTKCFEESESSCTYYDIKLADTVIVAYLRHDKFKEAKLVFENATKRSEGPFLKAQEKFMFFFLKKRQVELALCYLDAAIFEAEDEELIHQDSWCWKGILKSKELSS
ncbi:hypothetical protein TorRG33x02_329770 [Trema orientale]|uniref:Tetratricopeptide-like helical domain containing protein n=1 Tax=Trema orientale TaxID=63057 RepID=A0A2P5B890_TREOI|nr:hypothetical protein TorRG33x02_329770 [Trema orientale]